MMVQAVWRGTWWATSSQFANHVFLGAAVIQGLHVAEHIAQVAQKYFLGLPTAHGILGVLDTEWVHFAYNLALFAVLWFLVRAYGVSFDGIWRAESPWYSRALVLAAGAQSYHMVEHGAKLVQHLTSACATCPGLLGTVADLVWLHFTINLVVMVPMTIALVGFVLSSSQGGLDKDASIHIRR